jgi:hypothetical protein
MHYLIWDELFCTGGAIISEAESGMKLVSVFSLFFVLYLLSFGPDCAIAWNDDTGGVWLCKLYRPILHVVVRKPFNKVAERYIGWWISKPPALAVAWLDRIYFNFCNNP